jgi:hypothetical protein
MKTYLKCDLHIHSQFSDGKLSIGEIVDLYGRRNFGAIAITDHLCEKMGVIGRVSHGLRYSLTKESFSPYLETLKREADRAMKKYGMLLIPGFEITKNSFINHRSAHILILGTTEFIDPELSVDEILERAKAARAFTIAAHPFHTGEFEFQTFHLWSRREKIKGLIDAWEVNCRRAISSEILTAHLPLIANSDFHHWGHFASWKTRVLAEPEIQSVFDGIRLQKIDFFLDQDLALHERRALQRGNSEEAAPRLLPQSRTELRPK